MIEVMGRGRGDIALYRVAGGAEHIIIPEVSLILMNYAGGLFKAGTGVELTHHHAC